MSSIVIWIGAFITAALMVGVLLFYRAAEDRSRKERDAPAVAAGSTSKLRLELPKTPMAAPHFELPDPAGRKVSLKDLSGKVVFLNFWATWCPPCVEEMPAIEKLHQELEKQGLVVLAINFQEGSNRVKEFFTEHALTFTSLLDRDGTVTEAYQAWALPVTVIINKRGEIAAKAMGARPWAGEESLQFFRELLAE